jgi:two-component system osmolarity sensor histidine kinase EnvZ
MFFRWLKKYMPRGLYGRAALILIFPVFMLQLLVAVVFIQRHFDGVTRSMTRSANIELQYIQDSLASQDIDSVEDIASALGYSLMPSREDIPQADVVPFIDLTGNAVVRSLRSGSADVIIVSLKDRRRVRLWLATKQGPFELAFDRGRVSASNPHQLLVIMVVMGTLMTTIAYFFLRNQLRPIKRMADAAAAYGKGRMLPYAPSGAVEVRAAGTAFLEMRNRIERQTQSRTMMLSGVSHDLRTPLTRLRLGLSMIDDAEAAPLIRDVDEMQSLLDGFLDFARDDAEDVLERIHPDDFLARITENAARNNDPVTCVQGGGDIQNISVRPQAIQRALDNLIANGLRYGSQVTVSVSATDRVICLSVEDDGPGIPEKQREDALKAFVRLDPARNQNQGSGVGLGLAIANDIARSHGGVLRLSESDGLGGLRAELVLPI